ncbi:hypothetical protein ASG17_08885 [Brevundimonas sp. Leaf363]|uniref:NAD(P)/FAD-dependent oxidoreductase n=1 Tax=Brevundimonas sp. Leaf363 TaxID=1736353 RepID=UPI0006F23589|nr:FAD-dependent oxidoreductase [Brevundimonas sp. Leaf363]KQS56135.1 hypothetical protein ASG17_08885 [Brevundimonas sp. Leaf363]
MTSQVDIAVIGAGVLGLATAAEMTARGHTVTVIDPGGANASSVAAGMIAPAMEAALEGASPERAALFRNARDLWPAFAERSGIVLTRTGGVWLGADAAAVAERLTALGFTATLDGDQVVTPDDWQVAAEAALGRLRASVDVVTANAKSVRADAHGCTIETSTGAIRATSLVLATGAAAPLPGAPSDVAARIAQIAPVRGQIGRAFGAPLAQATRTTGGYLAPAEGGALIGATMETGRTDLAPDPAAAEHLLALADRLGWAPQGPVEWRVGVRGATADGLPMAGFAAPRLWLALAPRRNGWLLAPLVARVVADAIEGRTPVADAAALDPLRFTPAG